jgi:hypothetical protein
VLFLSPHGPSVPAQGTPYGPHGHAQAPGNQHSPSGGCNFLLAENRNDAEAPFAFPRHLHDPLSAHGKAQHQPLG